MSYLASSCWKNEKSLVDFNSFFLTPMRLRHMRHALKTVVKCGDGNLVRIVAGLFACVVCAVLSL